MASTKKVLFLFISMMLIIGIQPIMAQKSDSEVIKTHYNNGVDLYNTYVKKITEVPLDFEKLFKLLADARKAAIAAEVRTYASTKTLKDHYYPKIYKLIELIDTSKSKLVVLEQKKRDLDKALDDFWDD